MNKARFAIKSIFMTLLVLLSSRALSWGQTSTPEMATLFRSNGKIYVVVLVLATIFAGLFSFLIYLDKKIKNLENK
jgi:hypothetical protein